MDDVNPLISCLAYDSDDNMSYYARILMDSDSPSRPKAAASTMKTVKKVNFELDLDELQEKEEKNPKIKEKILEKLEESKSFGFDNTLDGKKKFVHNGFQMAAQEAAIPEKILQMELVVLFHNTFYSIKLNLVIFSYR